ncbi:MAG TPA: glycosyltransferase family 39 protein, partial [Paracoccaceae bacterium]|nr:glycosyltransferase family 39 protein [Paracoccaceae bacterium]
REPETQVQRVSFLISALTARLETTGQAILLWIGHARWRAMLVIALVSLAVALPGLHSLPVTDRDEARFAQSSKQMLESGKFIDIRLQEEPRWKKPVGIYWLQAVSAKLFGGGAEAGISAYRIPSVLGVLAAALLTAWAAWPLIGGRGAALAGVMLATSLLVAVEAHLAKTDAVLLATATAALAVLARLSQGAVSRPVAIIFWLVIAAAILLKGPVVPALVGLTLLVLWVLGQRLPLGPLEPLRGLALVALTVAPWLIAITYVSGGAFFAEALGRDFGAKLVSGQEKHWGPPGLYLALIWLTFWPWAALIPAALPWLWQRRRTDWLILFAAWLIPFWLVLEIVPTKLPHYVLPLYPALAIMLSSWASAEAPVTGRLGRIAGAALIAIPGAVLVALVVLLPLVLTVGGAGLLTGGRPDPIPSHVSWPAILLGLAGGAALIVAASAASKGQIIAQISGSILAVLCLYPAAFSFALPALGTVFPSPHLAAMISKYRACATGPAISVGYHEPSLVFLTETDIRLGDAAAAAEALRDDPGALVLVEERWRDRIGEEALAGTVERARTSYFNYNRGKAETAYLITPDDPRWQACGA